MNLYNYKSNHCNNGLSRREMLWNTGGGLGGIALASMLGNQTAFGDSLNEGGLGGLSGLPHHPPKAKRVIQLFMAGAASHVDLFDFKPQLIKQHGKSSDFG